MQGTLVVISVLIIAYLMISFYSVLIVIFVAFLLSTAVRPLVQRLQRFNIPPAVGVIITYSLLLGALIGIVVLVVPLVANQISAISTNVPAYYQDLRRIFVQSSSGIMRTIGLRLPVNPPEVFGSLGAQSADASASAANLPVPQLISIIGEIGKGLFVLIATLLLGFYWTLDGERIIRTLIQLVQPEQREQAREIVQEIQAKLGAYIRGQIILDLAVGSMAIVAYLLIGLDYALVLGILAGVLETVPILGPILGAVPPALIALASGNTNALIWVIVATVVIQQLEGAILVPRVMDRAVGVNAVVTLLAFAAFTSLLGLIGGLLAVPLAAIIQIIVIRLIFQRQNLHPLIERRDQFGVLRYQTQELGETVRMRARTAEDSDDDKLESIDDELEAIIADLDALLAQASAPLGDME